MVALLLLSYFVCLFGEEKDPLPSWNEGKIKEAILEFAKDTTNPESKGYIPPSERIAVFDQDGTLLVEKPLYTQLFFAIDKIKELAAAHPEWKELEPYATILNGDLERMKSFTIQDFEKVIALSHATITVDAFQKSVSSWLSHALHPRFNKRFTELVYQPMVEVIHFLQSSGYRVYIVSGGGQEFIRSYSELVYGIPKEQIIGSAGKVKYVNQEGGPDLIKLPEVLFVDDKNGKPEAINLFIGRRPPAAFGNSDGDREMLEWSQSFKGKNLQLLIHHDDPIREYQYDADSKIGTFSKALMKEAHKKGWLVVSMKNDWKTVFPTNSSNP